MGKYWSASEHEAAEKRAAKKAFDCPRPDNCLGDDDPMPFGKYKGEPMKFVPPGYLTFCGEQAWIVKWPKVQNYILWRQKCLEWEMQRAQREKDRRR